MGYSYSDTDRCISCGRKSLAIVCDVCTEHDRRIAPLKEELIKTLDLLKQYERRARNKINSLREQIIEIGCNHSETVPYHWEWDSGYGVQEWVEGKRCVLCGAKRSWKDMGLWHRERTWA